MNKKIMKEVMSYLGSRSVKAQRRKLGKKYREDMRRRSNERWKVGITKEENVAK